MTREERIRRVEELEKELNLLEKDLVYSRTAEENRSGEG